MQKEDLIDFETNLVGYWEAGRINAPLHLCGGNEDQLIEIFKEIKPHDYVFSGHRNHYHALLHGVDPIDLLNEILGKPDGRCMGRARSMGFIDSSRRFYSSAIVGGMCAPAVGVAWALQAGKKYNTHVWCFVGDGAVDGGHFWEALRYAEGYDLPVTFVIECNDRATCTNIISRCGDYYTFPNSSKVIVYNYEPTYPHVGTGKYVQF